MILHIIITEFLFLYDLIYLSLNRLLYKNFNNDIFLHKLKISLQITITYFLVLFYIYSIFIFIDAFFELILSNN